MIHRNEYVISKKRYMIEENWKYVQMPNGFVISYAPSLKITSNHNSSVVLLGWAWQVVEGKESPYDLIKNTTEPLDAELIIQMEKTWCGRYLIISGDLLFSDTSANLSVFYGDGIVSNSLYDIKEILRLPYKDPGVNWGVDFIPGGLTQYENIFRLLPEQYLNYNQANTSIRPLLPEGVIDFPSEKERIESFIKTYSYSLKGLLQEFKDYRLVLSLTGGVDSRTTFAFLVNLGMPFTAITYDYPNMKDGDRNIPGMLCRAAGIGYEYIVAKKCSRKIKNKRKREFKFFSMGLNGDYSSEYCYAHRIAEQLFRSDGENILVIGGAIWEICVSYYYFIGCFHKESIDDITEIEEAFPDLALKSNRLKREAAAKWFEMIKNTEENSFISDVNRFFWDIREGVWLPNDRAYDMYEGIQFIQPFNCRHFISILMGFDNAERMEKLHQKKMIRCLCPEISEIPYADDIDSKTSKIRKMKSSFLWRILHESRLIPYGISNYGLAECIRYYAIKIKTKRKRKD